MAKNDNNVDLVFMSVLLATLRDASKKQAEKQGWPTAQSLGESFFNNTAM